MKCSYCQNNKGGAYQDWMKGFSFNLCFDCCKKLGFYPNCLNTQIKCISCGEYFTPKGTWQNNCTDCWLKAHPEKRNKFRIVKKMQQEILIWQV